MSQLQVLHFLLNNTSICVDIKNVDKVMQLMQLEAVPGSPDYVVGLMNLAGKSVPVIDLSMRMGLKRKADYSLEAPILLCSEGGLQAGIIVDKVIGLSDVAEGSVQMRSEFNKPNSPFMATVRLNDNLSLMINMKHVLAVSLTDEEDSLLLDTSLMKTVR